MDFGRKDGLGTHLLKSFSKCREICLQLSKYIYKRQYRKGSNRFYMANASRNKGGTGLGLKIAKCLAKQMGGSLDADCIKSENDGKLLLRFAL